jgi:hypothetical protein
VSHMRSVVGAVIYFLIAVVIALGAAGLVSALDHPPGSSGRTDISTPKDAEVTARLDAAETDLNALADQVDALGTTARSALSALNGADATAGEADIEHGDQLVSGIITRTKLLREALAEVPYVGTPEAGLSVSDAVVARHAALVAALDATDGLDTDWNRLTIGALAASDMSRILAEHDRLVVAAADRGIRAKYADAIKLLDRAKGQITAARALRDSLKATVDVSVLDEWLTRNEKYDVALGNLYKAISKVGSKVTKATHAAVTAEAEARAQLPPDTRGLVLIMAQIGQGGMSQAVIAIEEARAALADAISAAKAPTPGPSDAPASTDSP